MSIDTLLDLIPDYAKDLRLNMSSVLRQTDLSEQQLWGTAVASAIASRNPLVTRAVLAEAEPHLTATAFNAARTAAALMGMNNIYYRFLHLTSNEKYSSIPARLRMQGIRNHGVDQVDFELWCAAVSAINGCGACVDSHEKVIREKGMTEESIAAAVRIASVIHAVAAVLDEAVPAQSLPGALSRDCQEINRTS
ncbi:MAG TPA: carboxymuconolactone decarboxylase family protein [Bryobacteraceae bacterium]|nr:carboxymuconolactone decarboxylase family protein [Bryobacteraceae bacterium]